jgi:hypothetical protein
MAWTVPFIASFSWARSSNLFIKRSIFMESISTSFYGMHTFLGSSFLLLALIRYHFIDESRSSINGEGEKSSSSSNVDVAL